jgi:phosphatidyl-myo-inositol alpha-mannosyltransferase
MKIAHIQPYDHAVCGGVREHVVNLARQHRAMGHDVTVIAATSRDAGTGRRDNPDGQYGWGGPDHSDVTLVGHGGIAAVASARSIARIPLLPVVWWRVRRLVRDGGFDVVHIHEPLVPLVALAATWHARTVTVGTIHGYRPSYLPYRLLRLPLDRMMHRLSARVAVSVDAREWVNRYFPGDYHVIPDGVDVTRFSDRAVLPVERYDDGRPNVLFVGRLEPRKGFPVLLDAWHLVQRAVPKARLLVAGRFDEAERQQWAREVARRQLDDVELVGCVSERDLPRYYRTAQVFCAPSTGYEALGIVLLEAMAAGAAVVTTDIEGYRTVVRDDVEAVVVPPADHVALADGLISVLEDAGKRERLVAAARTRVEEYAWPRLAWRLVRLYESLGAGLREAPR